jgi:MarR family transcriptional regulator, 2-MHQ and catechol-resistance regulon repressor
MPKPSGQTDQHSLAVQLAQIVDQPSVDTARALLKAGFLFSNRPERPYHAYGLNLAQVDVLAVLARAEETGLNCSEIAERTLITKGGITGILDRLEARGLVKRVPSQDDRRSISVRLSAKGVEFCRRFFPELARSDREIFAKAFTPEQIKQFSKLLALLVRSLEADSSKTRIHASELIHGDERS